MNFFTSTFGLNMRMKDLSTLKPANALLGRNSIIFRYIILQIFVIL